MPVTSPIVSKVWNYAHGLKNAGGGYDDYVEVRAARALITYHTRKNPLTSAKKLSPPSP